MGELMSKRRRLPTLATDLLFTVCVNQIKVSMRPALRFCRVAGYYAAAIQWKQVESPMSHGLRLVLLPLLLVCGVAFGQQEGRGLVVQGKLTTTDGAVPSGVTVLLEITDMRVRHQVGYADTRSMMDGTFSFNLDKYGDVPEFGLQINTVSPRYREAIKLVIVKAEEFPVKVELELTPGSVVKGKVFDDEGNPIPEVEISSSGVRPVKTNGAGEYELYGVNARGKSRVTARKEGYADVSTIAESGGPSVVEGIDFHLSSAATLSGRGIGPDGSPITRGMVTIRMGERYQNARLDEEGKFSFSNVPTDISELSIVMYSEQFTAVERGFTAEEQKSREVTLQAAWPLRLAGKLFGPDGKPLAGCEVLIGDGVTQGIGRYVSDANGEWEAYPFLPGSDIVVTALPASPEPRRESGELEFLSESKSGHWTAEVKPWPGGYRSTFEVTIEASAIRMVRTDEGLGGLAGPAIYEGTIDDEKKNISGKIRVDSTGATGEFTARSYGQDGRIRGVWDLRDTLGSGKYLMAPGQMKVKGAPFSGTQHVRQALGPPLRIAGVAMAEDGTALADGYVRLISWNGTQVIERESAIRGGGAFVLEGLPKGILQVAILDEKKRAVSGGIYLRGGLEGVEIFAGKGSPDPLEPVSRRGGAK